MSCDFIKLRDGSTIIVCSRGRRRKRCGWCMRYATRLCDGPKDGGTCDTPLCGRHAHQTGEELDLCPTCLAAGIQVGAQMGLLP